MQQLSEHLDTWWFSLICADVGADGDAKPEDYRLEYLIQYIVYLPSHPTYPLSKFMLISIE